MNNFVCHSDEGFPISGITNTFLEKGFILWTVLNVAVSLSIMLAMLQLYGKAVNMGWQQIDFSVCRMKMRGGIHRRIYGINIFYNGQAFFKALTKKEYTELCMNRTRKACAYTRKFLNRFLNPDFEKYEFSLRELDWHERDKKRCFGGFFFMLITMESIVCMIALEL